jgi:hypothetical protein
MNFRLMRDVGTVPAHDTPWLYLVHTDIPDHIVDEYNQWYDQEHLPRLVTVPGVVRARPLRGNLGQSAIPDRVRAHGQGRVRKPGEDCRRVKRRGPKKCARCSTTRAATCAG